MYQSGDRVPLYDHPDRFNELGRKRKLRRDGYDPDQLIQILQDGSMPESVLMKESNAAA